jgi:hypothetical protein
MASPRLQPTRSHRLAAVLVLALLGSGCPSDPFAQLVRKLGDPLRREEAIAGLLQLVEKTSKGERAVVRSRVVDALMDAYREDEGRAEIVTALAALGDARAAPVFAAALRDFERGGAYLEAAVRSARALAALGLTQEVPTLVEVLGRSLAAPQQEHTSWLKRALLEAIETLGDPRAVEVLVQVLRRDPSRQDFYLNKLAASALGRLRDRRAIRPLIAALSSQSHGLLLHEECRQALCRIGPVAVSELLVAAARREHGLPVANATAAARVLGDLGDRELAVKLEALAGRKDPAEHQLAVAEARLRLGDRGGEAALREVLESAAPFTARRSAADLLGWYGARDGVAELVKTQCLDKLTKRSDPAQKVLCWSLALAHARLATGGGLAQLGTLLAASDAQTRHYLQTYRPRLELASRCADDPTCYRKELRTATDWRARERAALELGRIAARDPAARDELAGAFLDAHPQVQEAILIALEGVSSGLDAAAARALARRLTPPPAPRSGAGKDHPAEARAAASSSPSTRSRALCLLERLNRMAGPSSRPGEKR